MYLPVTDYGVRKGFRFDLRMERTSDSERIAGVRRALAPASDHRSVVFLAGTRLVKSGSSAFLNKDSPASNNTVPKIRDEVREIWVTPNAPVESRMSAPNIYCRQSPKEKTAAAPSLGMAISEATR